MPLKSIMPETLFGEAGVFRGRSFNLYADLRTAITNNLNDNEHGSDLEHRRSRRTRRKRRDEE